jgi:hypothetical protein
MNSKSTIKYCAIVALIPLVLSTACATSRSVSATNAIATARYAIRDAETKGAERYASAELATARDKLEKARRATPDVGVKVAAEATVTARLAGAIAHRETAVAQLAEAQRVEREAEALRRKATDAAREQAR